MIRITGNCVGARANNRVDVDVEVDFHLKSINYSLVWTHFGKLDRRNKDVTIFSIVSVSASDDW